MKFKFPSALKKYIYLFTPILFFSPPAENWSIQADLPTSPDHPPNDDIPTVCLWKNLTVSYEDQKFDSAGFSSAKKQVGKCEGFSQASSLSPSPTAPLPLVEDRPPAPFPPTQSDDLQKLRKALHNIQPVLRQSCLLSLLSFVFLLYLTMVAGSVLLLILSIWLS